jgi:glycine hydroxymethyltransferase
LIDLTNKGLSGKQAEVALSKAGITVNKNTVPFDPRPPFDPSGIRLGTPALTTRGMKEKEMVQVAEWIDQALASHTSDKKLETIRKQIKEFARSFPLPS